ncbi:hypothetical protein [Lactiplantibacillus pentosus]|uniref:hypothetical protein n=1 Tax=Lactiplantibacillus pentosus TaxID=1589 RepID=UPI001C1DD416|nr:hypothetical protein [Lactiplantibacillus pentosus]MCC3164169.1 hypothetical protein [Lactiplantibacillus pentosus]MCJ8189281.1 hypothetical protein [Lactiplantibacillus pentosus]
MSQEKYSNNKESSDKNEKPVKPVKLVRPVRPVKLAKPVVDKKLVQRIRKMSERDGCTKDFATIFVKWFDIYPTHISVTTLKINDNLYWSCKYQWAQWIAFISLYLIVCFFYRNAIPAMFVSILVCMCAFRYAYNLVNRCARSKPTQKEFVDILKEVGITDLTMLQQYIDDMQIIYPSRKYENKRINYVALLSLVVSATLLLAVLTKDHNEKAEFVEGMLKLIGLIIFIVAAIKTACLLLGYNTASKSSRLKELRAEMIQLQHEWTLRKIHRI